MRGHDGVYRWVKDRGAGLRDETGKVYRMAGSLGDITAHKEIERAVAESEQFLATLVDNLPAVVFFRDLQGRYIRVNQKYQEVYPSRPPGSRGRSSRR